MLEWKASTPLGAIVVVSTACDCQIMSAFSPSRFSMRGGFTETVTGFSLVLRKCHSSSTKALVIEG